MATFTIDLSALTMQSLTQMRDEIAAEIDRRLRNTPGLTDEEERMTPIEAIKAIRARLGWPLRDCPRRPGHASQAARLVPGIPQFFNSPTPGTGRGAGRDGLLIPHPVRALGGHAFFCLTIQTRVPRVGFMNEQQIKVAARKAVLGGRTILRVRRRCPRCHDDNYHRASRRLYGQYANAKTRTRRVQIDCANCGHEWLGLFRKEEWE
jgi:hypothetical protein